MWSRSLVGAAFAIASVAGAQAPERDYVVLVASEAVDIISRVRFGPGAGPTLAKVEGVGSEPGTVEMIDLRTRQRVASADVGQMAGRIDVLKNP